ncbi:hypothetical protein, partial [Klebsiella pneumoniae]
HFSFKHPDVGRFVRGKTLGLDYERGTIENEFSRQIESSEERRVSETYTRVAEESRGQSGINGSTERVH